MPDKVLIYSRFPKSLMTRIGDHYTLLDAAGKVPADAFPADELKDVRALITAGGQSLPGDVMDMMPSLGAIICYGTGYDGVDFQAAAARGIVVGNSPGANASSVADLALTLMLTATRRILPADHYLREGGWSSAKPSPLMAPLPGNPGRKVGVYGMGEIGRKIAARVAAFECDVAYTNRTHYAELPYRFEPSLAALVEWCDVLMIAVRAGPETQHIIDADMLKKLGPNGTVVNISRGSVIDQAALTAALIDKTIVSAGLDVFEKEPQAPDALTALPNVVLTPHIGGHTQDSHHGMQNCVIANLDAFYAGRGLPHRVTV
jgi:hydroxypyruvate reductase